MIQSNIRWRYFSLSFMGDLFSAFGALSYLRGQLTEICRRLVDTGWLIVYRLVCVD